MSQEHIARTTTDVDGVDWTMYEAQVATRGPHSFRRWYECHICGFNYREDKVILEGGIAYCIPNRCYTEMDSKRGGQI